jgi:hypothetical protein
MRQVTEKILQRLALEKLILASQITPMRKKISLKDFLEAAKEEPRIYSALAAILLYKPQIFQNVRSDLKNYPQIAKFVDELFLDKNPHSKLFGHDKAFYQKSARTFREFLERKGAGGKTLDRILTIRLSQKDLDRLKIMTQKMATRSYGDTIRSLLRRDDGAPPAMN